MPVGSAARRDEPFTMADLAALPDDSAIDAGAVATMTSCSSRHVWRMADQGLLPAPLRLGRLRRWRVGTLREWLRDGAKPVR
jgi:predicted DNA-binding transcriptional regulator AlpA